MPKELRVKTSRPPIERMQRITAEINDGRYPNCNGLAKMFEVHAKTIQRDIEYMKLQLGAPIEYDKVKRGYFFSRPNWFLPAVFLSDAETFAMTIAEKILDQYIGMPAYNDVKNAFSKLLAKLPKTLTNESLYSFEPPPSSTVDERVFGLVQQSAKAYKKLHIQYYSASRNQTTVRVIHPYQIHQHEGVWYVIAYCETRQSVLTFALNRILDIEPLTADFLRPDDFDGDAFLKSAFAMHKGERRYMVVIWFSAYQARWIRERQWHRSQQLEEQPDGTLLLRLETENLDAVRRWVLKYGAEAEVLEPKDLRDAVIQEIQKMITQYGLSQEKFQT